MAKNALCIGIDDYPGNGMDLRSCVNDAQDWAQLLQQRGFGARTLRDAQATKAAMLEAMGSLIEQGDVLAITYSGHFSYDAHIADRFNGAFTHCALKALRTLGAEATYGQWHRAVTPALPPSVRCPQGPQLVGDAVAWRARVFA